MVCLTTNPPQSANTLQPVDLLKTAKEAMMLGSLAVHLHSHLQHVCWGCDGAGHGSCCYGAQDIAPNAFVAVAVDKQLALRGNRLQRVVSAELDGSVGCLAQNCRPYSAT